MKLEDYFKIFGNYEFKNGVYDVDGNVNLMNKVVKLPVKFGKVTGHFNISNNNLTSLEGCPTHVGMNFGCSHNYLINLKGCPRHVSGHFFCSYNRLVKLEDCPTHVGGTFDCHSNFLTSLEGSPNSVGGSFLCDENLQKTKEYKQFKILEKLRS